MTSLPTIVGFLGTALLAACALAPFSRIPSLGRAVLALGASACVLIPVQGVMVAEYVRGALGDFSLVTQALLAVAVAQYVAGRTFIARREHAAIMATVVLGGLFLYPAALGLTRFDPYALGYGSTWFVGALLVLALAAWQLRFEWLLALLLIATAARLANALESRNLWDYLIDPLLVLYATLWLVRSGLQRPWRAALRSAASSSIR